MCAHTEAGSRGVLEGQKTRPDLFAAALQPPKSLPGGLRGLNATGTAAPMWQDLSQGLAYGICAATLFYYSDEIP